MTVIHWFRRDLRLKDNTALHHACETGKPVIPLFIIDTRLLKAERIGMARLKFMLDALYALDESLQKLETNLLVRHGNPLEIMKQVIAETGAEELFFNRDYTPYARKRDTEIEGGIGIACHVYEDSLLLPPEAVLKNDGSPYMVYTPYWKRWKEISKASISDFELQKAQFQPLNALKNDRIPSMRELGFSEQTSLAQASEDFATGLLEKFIQRDVDNYDEKRNWLVSQPFAANRPEGSSYLSPYLRFGILSPRQVYWASRDAYSSADTKPAKDSIEKYVGELAWREFYAQILYHFPHVLQRDFVETYRNLEWREAPDDLDAWKTGQTGYPIIDAPMRQLKAIGWMPNRTRMIVASFLTKDLLIHWRYGDIHFMQHLLDGDVASNNGGWQWAAGTGTDAQPYFRIFNPVSQSQKFATPAYLREWLPELSKVPDKFIHTPWEMTHPPKDYPAPIVDHQFARERTLAAFKKARGDK